MFAINRALRWLALGMIALATTPTWSQSEVGTTVYARGVSTAASGRDIRLIGEGTPIFEGDTLSVGEGSFAIISFADGTRMTLRPETVFQVESYSDSSGSENAVMRLFKGGLRALTGLLSRKNPDAFKLRTTIATIGIRGTDFSARLCGDDDCAGGSEDVAAADAPANNPAIARVAFVSGSLTAQTENGQLRRMEVGSAVYETDLLETGPNSFAVIGFNDDSRITLQAETTFLVRRHQYSAGHSSQNSALYELIKGGLRAVSGLISRENPDGYKVETPVAIIGIRSTKFDLVCQGSCLTDNTAGRDSFLATILDALISPARAAVPEGDGLYVVAREGEIYAERDGRSLVLPQNETYFLMNIALPPVIGADLPVEMLDRLGPLPEDTDVPSSFFAAKPVAASEPGLFVAVYDEGHATVAQRDGETFHIGRDEAVHVSGEDISQVAGGVPAAIRQDPYNFNPSRFSRMSLLRGDVPSGDDDNLECAVR